MVCEERENNHPVHKSHASLRTCIYHIHVTCTCTCTVTHASPGMLLCPLEESVLYKGTAYRLCLLAGLFSSVGRASAYIKLRVVGSSPVGVHFFFHFLSITGMLLSASLSACLPACLNIHVYLYMYTVYVHTCMYMYTYV